MKGLEEVTVNGITGLVVAWGNFSVILFQPFNGPSGAFVVVKNSAASRGPIVCGDLKEAILDFHEYENKRLKRKKA